MPAVNTTKKGSAITWLDVLLVLILFMGWLFLRQAWSNPVAGDMLAASSMLVAIYIIARFTGFLQFLKLTLPVWTLGAILGIVFWPILLAIVPSDSQSTVGPELQDSVLTEFFEYDTIARALQIIWFPATESLIVIFLLAFFVGVASKRLGDNQSSVLLPLVIVSAFASLLHVNVAKINEKVLSFGVNLVQQFVSFLFMALIALFLGSPVLITSHWMKNALILGSGTWIIGILIFCLGMDLISITLFKQDPKLFMQTKKLFT